MSLSLGLSSLGNMMSLSTLLSGASTFLSNAQQNKYQKQADQRANNYNLAMWNMQNEYNTPANQMKRYAEAGLNPFLIYGQGNAGNASSPPSAQVTPKQAPRIDLMQMVSSALQMQAFAKEIELKDAQIKNVESKTETDGAKRADMFLNSVRKGQELNSRLQDAVARRQLTYEQAARVRQIILAAPEEFQLKRDRFEFDKSIIKKYPEVALFNALTGHVRGFWHVVGDKMNRWSSEGPDMFAR